MLFDTPIYFIFLAFVALLYLEEDRRGNLEEAMSASGVPLITTPPKAFSAEDYIFDVYHLTDAAAVKYARILAPQLRGAIADLYREE
jgi:hypothetical protein